MSTPVCVGSGKSPVRAGAEREGIGRQRERERERREWKRKKKEGDPQKS